MLLLLNKIDFKYEATVNNNNEQHDIFTTN